MPKQDESTFVIQSKIDNQQFTVDKIIIDSSALLKNICDITEITEPILINCPGHSSQIYINLISHYQTIKDEKHDAKFEKNLYDSVTLKNRKNLIKLIQDLCILDSDFFLDSVADYILGIIGIQKKKSLNYIRKYFGFENDFTEKERNLIENEAKVEYFLSMNTKNFKFPFENKSLYSLKTDFTTPMNALIARIIQRSNPNISYLFSLINKTLKNEVDRHPFKLTEFSATLQHWTLELHFKKLRKGFSFFIDCKTFGMQNMPFNEEHIKAIKRRKIIANEVSILYDNTLKSGEPFIDSNSLDFVIPKSDVKIIFQGSYKTIYHFDMKKCPFSSIFYRFTSTSEWGVKFEEFYEHLIAKDLSKAIRIQMSNDIFKFFYPRISLQFIKKPNFSKFESLQIRRHQEIYPEFKNFLTNYMEDDGFIKCSTLIVGMPTDGIDVDKIDEFNVHDYKVSDVKKYWDCIVAK